MTPEHSSAFAELCLARAQLTVAETEVKIHEAKRKYTTIMASGTGSQMDLTVAKNKIVRLKTALEQAKTALAKIETPGASTTKNEDRNARLRHYLPLYVSHWNSLKRMATSNNNDSHDNYNHVLATVAPAGSRWFFMGKDADKDADWNTLVVRKSYLDLLDDVMLRFSTNMTLAARAKEVSPEWPKAGRTRGRAIVMVGPAGTGKTTMLNYLAQQAAKLPNVTVICHWGEDAMALVLPSQGNAYLVDVGSLEFTTLLQDFKTLHLYDPIEKGDQNTHYHKDNAAFFVMAARPDVTNYKDVSKGGKNTACEFRYVGQWNYNEVLEALPIMILDLQYKLDDFIPSDHVAFHDAVEEYYQKVGGSLRMLLWKLFDNNDAYKKNCTTLNDIGYEKYFNAEIMLDVVRNMPDSVFQSLSFLYRLSTPDASHFVTIHSPPRSIEADSSNSASLARNHEARHLVVLPAIDSGRLFSYRSCSHDEPDSEHNESDPEKKVKIWRKPVFMVTSELAAWVLNQVIAEKSEKDMAWMYNIRSFFFNPLTSSAKGSFFEAALFACNHPHPFPVYALKRSETPGSSTGYVIDTVTSSGLPQLSLKAKISLSQATDDTPCNTFSGVALTADRVAERLERFVFQLLADDNQHAIMAFPEDPNHVAVDAYRFAKEDPTPCSKVLVNAGPRTRSSTAALSNAVDGTGASSSEDLSGVPAVDLRITLLQVKYVTTPVPHWRYRDRASDLKDSFQRKFKGLLKDKNGKKFLVKNVHVDYCYVVDKSLNQEHPFSCTSARGCYAIIADVPMQYFNESVDNTRIEWVPK